MIDVLISTYGEGINKAITIPLKAREDVNYIISHQSASKLNSGIVDFINSRDDVNYYSLNGKGLSKNRNNAIKLSTSELIYFCDDDVCLDDDIFDNIIAAFNNCNADAISFKIKADDGLSFKKYRNKVFKHNILSIFKISSIELVCKRNSILDNGIVFDERFGIASSYIASEENIFVSDMIKYKLNVFYVPIFIVKHPVESSGKNWSSKELIYSKGALFKRIFGPKLGVVFVVLFAIKKYGEYRGDVSFFGFLRESLLGYKEYF